MIGYVTLGTTDLAKSGAFYDELLGSIGASRMMEEPGYFIPKLPQDACFRAVTALSGQGTLAKECGYLSNKCNDVMEAL